MATLLSLAEVACFIWKQHRLIRKLELIEPGRYPGLDQAVHATVLVLKSPQAQAAIDPLPRHLAELGFAAHYFLKECDLIPDKTPEVGFADDLAIFKQVFARNFFRLHRLRQEKSCA